jgi:uncharacterized protein (DUF1684 family)
MTDLHYLEKITKFRQERERRMTANERNWLSLVGLFPLVEGENTFGQESNNLIVMPSLPTPHGGSFHLQAGIPTLRLTQTGGIKVNGRAPDHKMLRTDQDTEPDVIEVGTLIMMVIRRGERLFLRVWDRESSAAKNFSGLNFYPVKLEYCLTARFIKFEESRKIGITDKIGSEHETSFIGKAEFELNGSKCSLLAEEDEDELLFSFVDQTRRDSTYPGGRLLNAPKAVNGFVTLDFNLAINWPCAYTAFATCPLPPMENHLNVRIEAGEMKYSP